MALKHIANAREPFDSQTPFYVLVETQGSNKEHDDAKLDQFLTTLMEDEIVSDGVVAQDSTQAALFWEIREGIPEACSKEGGMYKYDLSVPVSELYNIVLDMRKRLEELGFYQKARGAVRHVVGFGHMGDGNLHLNIMTSGRTKQITDAIEPFVYEITSAHNGSISAEHGLGVMKAPYLGYSKSQDMISMMKQIKTMFDPKGILNPYKFLG